LSQSDSTWSFVDEGNVTPNGFLFAGISAGLKASNKKDLALILAPEGSIFSGMFTQSIVRASCVDICEERIKKSSGFVRAILINSGQANACTGNLGIQHFQIATGKIAELLGIKEEEVLMCSTGVIGVPIKINDLVKNLPNLVSDLKGNNFQNAAEAILTTDLTLKKVLIETIIQGRKIKIAGLAKGSGMIYPNMATMLAFLTCDAGIEKKEWDKMISIAVKKSFNAISVDGETSTNDSFIGINAGNKIDKNFVQFVDNTNRKLVDFMLSKMSKYIDVIIPRGGKNLVKRVQEFSKVPIIGHLEGICHTFVDKDAELNMAAKVIYNAKLRNTSICGATETILLHKKIVKNFCNPILKKLEDKNCKIYGDNLLRKYYKGKVYPAKEKDWSTEYLKAAVSVKVVKNSEEAINHINKYGTMHTDSIITKNKKTAKRFLKNVKSSIAMHNTSTQFADGGEFGFGGEVGISTNTLPPRGPVGLEQLVSFKYEISSRGKIRD